MKQFKHRIRFQNVKIH